MIVVYGLSLLFCIAFLYCVNSVLTNYLKICNDGFMPNSYLANNIAIGLDNVVSLRRKNVQFVSDYYVTICLGSLFAWWFKMEFMSLPRMGK